MIRKIFLILDILEYIKSKSGCKTMIRANKEYQNSPTAETEFNIVFDTQHNFFKKKIRDRFLFLFIFGLLWNFQNDFGVI